MTNNAHAFPTSALIAFACEGKQRPRGAWFADPSDKLIAALTSMRCQVLRSVPKAMHSLAKKLPEGRLLSSGKVILPSIQKDLHEKLAAASVKQNFNELSAALNERLLPDSHCAAHRSDQNALSRYWDDLRAGDVVLAPVGPDEGWWEATVIDTKKHVVELKYCDFPEEPTFLRHVSTLAQIHPDLS